MEPNEAAIFLLILSIALGASTVGFAVALRTVSSHARRLEGILREWGGSDERIRKVEDAVDMIARDVTRIQEEQDFLSRLISQSKQGQLPKE